MNTKPTSSDTSVASKPTRGTKRATSTSSENRTTQPLWADVLIIGGGFVGGALATALARSGLTALVAEAGVPQTTLQPRFDGRSSAISLSSKRMLTELGIWDALADQAGPMLDIRVADGKSRLFLHYDHQQVGDQPFGYMLENRHLRKAILDRLLALPGVTLVAPARVESLVRDGGDVEATLADGRRLRARVAVAADGRNSRTREDAGIRVTRWSYRQSAIVCTVRHERAHGFVAHEHFLPAGPFAILPLVPGDRSSIVWTERSALAETIMASSDSVFLDELRRRFGDFLGDIELEGPRFSYPLSLQYANQSIATRLALVGDAAHAMHPIAGQGLNMGFRDVAALTQVSPKRDHSIATSAHP
ncbi:MAG: UbiH/UbiF/VisC/COQ6 family ubiquinone biosynthesis hydroxylase, partial [Rhodospirillales bacterium]|nr:UbiH/UbiF/VisC/COQ6 family ubiquinone biosynthesis hydroxylase [Rhodospirillales bacterium]